MKKLVKKVLAILNSKNGESLMESLVSILVFTILVAAVTMMILLSLRITRSSTEAANESQEEVNSLISGTDGAGDSITSESGSVGLTIDGITIEIPVTVSRSGNYTAFEPNLNNQE